MSLKNVKGIKQESRNIVFGFVRRVQESMPKDIVYYTIPKLIIYWCLLYFHQQDTFDPQNCSTNFELSMDNTLVTNIKKSGRGASAYLSEKVKNGAVHRWRFQVFPLSKKAMTIGVWKTKYPISTTSSYFITRGFCKSYGWIITGNKLSKGDVNELTINNKRKRYGKRICVGGDIIDMILDLDRKELRYMRNEEDYGVAFENIEDTEYVAAIDMSGEQDLIQIISYQHYPSNKKKKTNQTQ